MGDLLEAVADLIDRGRAAQAPQGRASWWWWVIGGVLALGGLALGWWLLRGHDRELAKLRHERFRADQAAKSADIEAQVKAHTDQAATHEAEADAQRVRRATVDLSIQAAKLRYAQDLAAVDRVRAWRDVAPDPR